MKEYTIIKTTTLIKAGATLGIVSAICGGIIGFYAGHKHRSIEHIQKVALHEEFCKESSKYWSWRSFEPNGAASCIRRSKKTERFEHVSIVSARL